MTRVIDVLTPGGCRATWPPPGHDQASIEEGARCMILIPPASPAPGQIKHDTRVTQTEEAPRDEISVCCVCVRAPVSVVCLISI